MPNCQAINYAGNICNQKSNELNYFWFYDPHGRINKVFYLCQKHSNILVDGLMEKEKGYANLITACYDQIKKKRNELEHGSNLTEQREAIKNARENGIPAPHFKSVQELKNEINKLYETISNAKKIVVIERNKVCRYCKYTLREPESPKDQLGERYANIDFKSYNGYRRLDAMFHTECAIAWLTNKLAMKTEDMKYLQPKRTGQQTIFSSMEICNVPE